MSGVFGFASSRPDVRLGARLRAMADAMTHFDWQQAASFSDREGRIGLGRLGIGVFNRGPQPVWNADASIALVMSGELDGHPSSDERDETTIAAERHALSLYERLGESFVARLRGAFVIAVWDARSQRLVVSNDRFGLYPLYYAHTGGVLRFAPAVQGILADERIPRRLELVALAEYVRFQTLLGDKTFLEHVRLLPNASALTYDLQSDRVEVRAYWSFGDLPTLPARLTFDDAVEEAGTRLQKATQRLSGRGPLRVGIYLSGGLDSRTLLGFAHQTPPPLCITYGLADSRDVRYARRLADRAAAPHRYFEFCDGRWVSEYVDLHLTLTEGFHSWIHSHGISVLGAVRSLIDVNLTGFGGGHTAADWSDPGVERPADESAFAARMLHLLSQRTTWPSIDDAEEGTVYAPVRRRELQGLAFESLRAELARHDTLPHPIRAAYFALCNPDRRMFQYFTVFNRSHVEQRFPFFDYDYAEFVYALPLAWSAHRRLRRALIARRLPALARMPYDLDELPVTSSRRRLWPALARRRLVRTLHRLAPGRVPLPRTLYADYEGWIRRELRAWGEGILLGDRTLARGVFEPAALRALWARQQSGSEENVIGKIAPIMTWEMLARRFVDGARET